jgi:hypothetical protein
VQRLYSLFPQGRPGLGLILLRVCVVVSLALPLARADAAASNGAVQWLFGTLMAGVLAGFLTPLLCLLVVATVVVDVVQVHEAGLLLHVCCSGFAALAATSLALLGPGAYSIDAWLYGRRVLRLPRR